MHIDVVSQLYNSFHRHLYAQVSHRAIVLIAYDMNPNPDALEVPEIWRHGQPVNGVSSPIPHLFYL